MKSQKLWNTYEEDAILQKFYNYNETKIKKKWSEYLTCLIIALAIIAIHALYY